MGEGDEEWAGGKKWLAPFILLGKQRISRTELGQ
jgi:hypothetical protein